MQFSITCMPSYKANRGSRLQRLDLIRGLVCCTSILQRATVSRVTLWNRYALKSMLICVIGSLGAGGGPGRNQLQPGWWVGVSGFRSKVKNRRPLGGEGAFCRPYIPPSRSSGGVEGRGGKTATP